MDYFTDAVDRCVRAAIDNDRHPFGVWSTGEKLLVALVLWDQQHLDAEHYSYPEAMNRVASGIDRTELPGWLDRVPLIVDAELDELD
jgi:hypothetical protein